MTTVEYGIIIAAVGIAAIAGTALISRSLSSSYVSGTNAEVGVCVGAGCPAAAEVPPPAGFVDTPGGGGAADQTIGTVSFTPSTGATVGGSATVAATATSGLTVTFTSATSSVCTVSGTTVSFVSAGQCTINANQAGNSSWNPAPLQQGSMTVVAASGPQNQTIGTVTITPASSAKVGLTGTVSATATSSLPVTFTSATTSVCTVSGTYGQNVAFVGAGTCTINANQAGDGVNWNAATQTSGTISVSKGDQTIGTVMITPATSAKVGLTGTVSATATSSLPVTFTSATTSICTVSGTNGQDVNFVGVGTCTINANQNGDTNWNAATQVSGSLSVPTKGDQTITFTMPSTGSKSNPPGKSTVTLSASASSGLAVTLSASPNSLCAIESDGVTLWLKNATGDCTVTATQAGNANWNAATPVALVMAVS